MASRGGCLTVLAVAAVAAYAGSRMGFYALPFSGTKHETPAATEVRTAATPSPTKSPAPEHEPSIFDMTHLPGLPSLSPASPSPVLPAPAQPETIPDARTRLRADVAHLTAAERQSLASLQARDEYREAKAAREAAADRARAAVTSGDDRDRAAAARDLAARTQAVSDMERSAYAADALVAAAERQVEQDRRALDRLIAASAKAALPPKPAPSDRR